MIKFSTDTNGSFYIIDGWLLGPTIDAVQSRAFVKQINQQLKKLAYGNACWMLAMPPYLKKLKEVNYLEVRHIEKIKVLVNRH